MIIETSSWGILEIQEDQIYVFNKGIPGFEDEKEFAIIPYENSPFGIMQSMSEPGLSFLLADPFLFEPEYEFELPDHETTELDIESSVWVRCIVTLQSSIEESSLNLLAPIVINPDNNNCKQIVLHQSGYQTKHKMKTLSAAGQLFAKGGE
ncbi:flagellar assembly protein FliW [Paenibacillus sp. 453mf]|uniref:flagellar assembly protein FliW n=1 Tax=Paenibacillus sp. 453mf TaxID=1761874 RepID=UPI0008EE6210|nr:flagellar assembly protein FliW [Paenibacillus sp. 453mf]SFS85300.1 flagellar assembly factor FliW [Paenibacillus sp. 453mf]